MGLNSISFTIATIDYTANRKIGGRGKGFYYVFSRYYKPEIERRINADDTAILYVFLEE